MRVGREFSWQGACDMNSIPRTYIEKPVMVPYACFLATGDRRKAGTF